MDTDQTPHQDAPAHEVDDIRGEVERLSWNLADGRISDVEAQRLEQLLQEHSAARDVYINCMQLRADLQQMFGEEATAAENGPAGTRLSPILRNLDFSSTGDDAQVPQSDRE